MATLIAIPSLVRTLRVAASHKKVDLIQFVSTITRGTEELSFFRIVLMVSSSRSCSNSNSFQAVDTQHTAPYELLVCPYVPALHERVDRCKSIEERV